MALKQNSKTVYNYVKEHEAENITAADIAQGTGIAVKSINGIVTSAFQKKGLMQRVVAEIKEENGDAKTVKFIVLTEEGKNLDVDAE